MKLQLKQARKDLKQLGYKISTESLSYSRFATLHHVESGEKNTGNVYTSESIKKWEPAFSYLRDCTSVYDGDQRIIGLSTLS